MLFQNYFRRLVIYVKSILSYNKNRFWTRALICWLLSSALLKLDAVESYDARFKIRGESNDVNSIVLVTINPNEFAEESNIFSSNKQLSSLIRMNELSNSNDYFFWDTDIWTKMLKNILADDPEKIGVSLYFGDSLKNTISNIKDFELLTHKKIIWSTSNSVLEKTNLPFTSLIDRSNIASIQLTKDDDSVVRRLVIENEDYDNIALKVSDRIRQNQKSFVINFSGLKKYPVISFTDVLNKKYPPHFFKNKIIFIGAEKSTTQQVLTPLGQISRNEFWAEVTYNYLSNSFIKKLPIIFYIFLLFLLMLLSVFIITKYPQTVSFYLFIWVATVWTAFSIWIFDTYATWIPVASCYALLTLIWLTHIGYQVLKIEKAHYKLQQEQNYLAELEQLKNNFVSLISHDLKTPIAKIQAVVDRLNLQNAKLNNLNASPTFTTDLTNLKEYSEELNKYIQSILKLLRVESKEFKIHKETADLNGIVENVIARVKPLALAKNIKIETILEPMFLIEFDITLMAEVILNLVENAIKYTPDFGTVEIHTTENDHYILIEVKDTGEGIDPNELEHIWKKFARGKNQDLKTKGSGLGLYLAKYFIELHGGKISVRSELNKGTTFYIQLPIDLNSEDL